MDQHVSEIKIFCNIIHYTIQKLRVSIINILFYLFILEKKMIEINTFI